MRRFELFALDEAVTVCISRIIKSAQKWVKRF